MFYSTKTKKCHFLCYYNCVTVCITQEACIHLLVQILFYFGATINVSWQHCQWHFCVQHKDKNIPFFVERQICYVGLCSFHIKKAKDPTYKISYNKIKPSTSCIKEFFCRKGDQKTWDVGMFSHNIMKETPNAIKISK